MSSFYGHGWNINNNITSDYYDLLNKPVVNLIGTETSPITFSDLGYGNYLIKGFYRYSANDNNKQSNSLSIQVTQDQEIDEKVVKFEVIENKEIIIVTVFYDNDNSFIESRFALNNQGGDFPSNIAEEIVLGTF